MKVGLTYDLRDDYLAEGCGKEETAEFDRIDTIEGIENALRELGFETDRIGNFKRLVGRAAEKDRWDIVFNIAEGMYGIGRESQVPALLDAYRIPYTFSDPLILSLALHKALTKIVVRNAGIATPDFAEVKSEADIDAVNLPFPLFAKPVAEGTGKGVSNASMIKSKQELKSVCMNILDAFKQPALVETFLPGREFTVGLVGTGSDSRAIGVMEVVYKDKERSSEIYSYFTKANYEEIVEYKLVEGEVAEACKALSLKVWNVLDCKDAGRVDLRLDAAGAPNFIEINPLAGLNPTHSDLPILCRLLGIPFRRLIEEIMESALKRYNLPFVKI